MAPDRDYVDDVRAPEMLHAALHLTAHSRADIVVIDTTAAAAAPGVAAVFTAADIAGELKVGIIHKDWPVMIPVGGRTSYAGDVLAIVVADTRQQARAAAELVEVGYEVLEPVTDPEAALDDGAPVAVWGTEGTCRVSEYRALMSMRAWATSAHPGTRVSHAAHRAAFQREHLPSRDDRRCAHPNVYSGGHGVGRSDDLARVPRGRQRRGDGQRVSNGCCVRGQGGHEQPGAASLASWLLDRPLKCTLSREGAC